MIFPLPTTKDEMFSTLKDIFYYYRIKKAEFEEVVLNPLALTRLDFTPLNDLDLLKKADDLVSYEQQSELNKIRLNIDAEIDDYNKKMQELTKAYNNAVENIVEKYNKSALEIQEKALIHGVGQTSTVTAQLSQLESEKNQDLLKAENEFTTEQGFCTAKIQELTSRREGLNEQYSVIFEKQKLRKFTELKDEQDKLLREIFKYNNLLDEKEQRSKNSVAQSNATLQLKYMEIRAENFSKDQLIEMGYYADVIDCVCSYYNTMSALDAWRNITNDDKVAIYLEEYYTQIVYMYQQRAGVV